MCNNYIQFGGRWLYYGKEGDKKNLPRKRKHLAIMWVNPKVWNSLRLSVLNEAETDMLVYLMFGVKPNVNPKDMNVETKQELWEMLYEQYAQFAESHPQRLSQLSADLDNVQAKALEFNFPRKYVPGPEHMMEDGSLIVMTAKCAAPEPPQLLRNAARRRSFPDSHVTIEDLDSSGAEDQAGVGADADESEPPEPEPKVRKLRATPQSRDAAARVAQGTSAAASASSSPGKAAASVPIPGRTRYTAKRPQTQGKKATRLGDSELDTTLLPVNTAVPAIEDAGGKTEKVPDRINDINAELRRLSSLDQELADDGEEI